MKSVNPRLEALIILLTAIPFLYVVFVWNDLPARITSHYDLNGKPNATMPKVLFTSIMAGLSVLTYTLLLVPTRLQGVCRRGAGKWRPLHTAPLHCRCACRPATAR